MGVINLCIILNLRKITFGHVSDLLAAKPIAVVIRVNIAE